MLKAPYHSAGSAIIADQGRVAMGVFLDECRQRGLVVNEVGRVSRPSQGTSSGTPAHTITFHEVRRA